MDIPATGWLAIYFVLAAIVVFLAIKLSNYVDLLDKKTKLSGALLGGILLAAVTSLPELFTALTSTITNNIPFVMGDIMGSDFFDIVIFAIVYFLFFKKLVEKKLGKQHYYTMFFVLALLIAVTCAAFIFDRNGWLIGYFNPMSIAIVAIYVVSIWKTPKTEEKDEGEKEKVVSTLSVKRIWILFSICSVLLIGASILVTLVTDKVVTGFGIGETFGGSLFLGIATSLPEVTATIALCKKKNFNAAFGDILGSCVFNILILSIADALAFNGSTTIYKIDTSVDSSPFFLLIGTAFVLLLAFISILFIRSPKCKNNVKSRVFLYAIAVLLIGSYVAYLVLSALQITFPL